MFQTIHFAGVHPALSDADFPRPFCGWYDLIQAKLTLDGASAYWLPDSCATLALLELHIGAFRDSPLPETALAEIDRAIGTLCEKRGLILRFLYDWDGDGENAEPEAIETVLCHIRQAGTIAARYADRILVTQGLFIGSWGEMHSSKFNTSDAMGKLLDAVLDAFAPISVSVRTPAQRERLLTGRISRHSAIGLFNDALLGSDDDLGTFIGTRAENAAYTVRTAESVPFGGELLCGEKFDAEECRRYLAACGTTYLNRVYDSAAIKVLQNTMVGEKTAFETLGAHLGYRFRIGSAVQAGETIRLSVHNTGVAKNARPLTIRVTRVGRDGTETLDAAGDEEILPGTNRVYTIPLPKKRGRLYATAAVGGEPVGFANQTEKDGVYLGSCKGVLW